MKKCAYLVSDPSLSSHPTDSKTAQLQFELLQRSFYKDGWLLERVCWSDQTVRWNAYSAAIAIGVWDYHKCANDFVNAMARIEQAGCYLWNPLSLLQWNVSKYYLRELEEKGISTIPTLWFDTVDTIEWEQVFRTLATNEVVVKPLVSAGAYKTFRIKKNIPTQQLVEISDALALNPLMVQPMMQTVISEGEFSLIFFHGQFSHAVLKKPAVNDFRVQQEYGGIAIKISLTDSQIDEAYKMLKAMGRECLYARVDVCTIDRRFCLMEMELIEPYLFLESEPLGADRFVTAFLQCNATVY